MSSQGSLPGFETSEPTDRLFLAIFPDGRHADQLAAVADTYLADRRLGAGAVEADRLHVTAFHLGDYVGLPPGLVANATEALSRLVCESFAVRFDQIGSFSHRAVRGPLVLAATEGNDALHAMHKQLATHLRACGLGQHTHDSFTPHMTMAYEKATMPFENMEPVVWPAGEVRLVHSLLGKTRHIRLAEKRLS
ncbi:2'-5' RNA ligase family protein [Dyella sp. 2HG41-7]|uniref:2'-5' RNA ligase family protein n=1 Tax=Dyella sp. 2HG41-7 TaxID=2883239 RepID=UPI001F19FA70|nr:2'-5' RNA ligase family protein [Dyella sp. 2HG41-7]